MPRLIDADKMRENLLWCKEQSSSYDNYWDDVIERLDAQPTVEEQEPIRPEREKVIKGLELCYYPPSKCDDCPYYEIEECNDTLCRDALELLKGKDDDGQ